MQDGVLGEIDQNAEAMAHAAAEHYHDPLSPSHPRDLVFLLPLLTKTAGDNPRRADSSLSLVRRCMVLFDLPLVKGHPWVRSGRIHHMQDHHRGIGCAPYPPPAAICSLVSVRSNSTKIFCSRHCLSITESGAPRGRMRRRQRFRPQRVDSAGFVSSDVRNPFSPLLQYRGVIQKSL